MLIYGCLSNYEGYKDRYKMFAAMCEHGVRVRMILLHGKHPPASDMPEGFEQLSIPPGTNIFTRRKYMREHLVAASNPECTIVHDTFVAQMGLQLRNRWKRKSKNENVRNVLSLYFTTASYLWEGHWQGKSEEFKVGLKDWPYYLGTYVPSFFGEMLSCHLADAVTGNSEEIIKDVQRYYRIPSVRTKFISAEIDTDFYRPGPSKREELGLSRDDKAILYAGLLQRHKGIDVLLRAFEILAHHNRHMRLILLGKVGDTGHIWFKDMLQSLSSKSQIDIRGAVDSNTLRKYYQSCDVFIIPTYHEGSPRVVKEAMACGLPVVTSRISGNLAIDPEGESLVYASDWNPAEYADLMDKVLNDSEFRQRRIEAGLTLVQNLSPEKVAQRYLDLYFSLF